MTITPNDERDDLGGMLRQAARGSAPLSLDPAGTRRRADSRHRRNVGTAVLGAAVAAVAVTAVLVNPTGGTSLAPEPADSGPPVSTTAPSIPPTRHTPAPDPSAITGPAPAATAPAAAAVEQGRLELRGDDLGVTAIGASRAAAVAAVTAVLGAPAEDPSTVTRCVDATAEVAWEGFVLAFDAQGQLSGWSSSLPRLVTPSGLGPGTTVATLQRVYGDRLHLAPADPDNGATYMVDAVDMTGYLTDGSASGEVVALSNGDCHPI